MLEQIWIILDRLLPVLCSFKQSVFTKDDRECSEGLQTASCRSLLHILKSIDEINRQTWLWVALSCHIVLGVPLLIQLSLFEVGLFPQHQCSTDAALGLVCETLWHCVAILHEAGIATREFKGSRFWRIRKRSTHVKRLMLSDRFCVEYTFDSHITLWPSRAREMDRHGGRFQQCFRSGQASQPRRWC